MANTPIYGWETPDDTDYVYQGAAAARTTANAIDSTLSSQVSTINGSIATTNANLAATDALIASNGQKWVSWTINNSDLIVASTTNTLFFSGGTFTPAANRLYLVTYTINEVQKTTNAGGVFVRLQKNNAAGTVLDRVYLSNLSAFESVTVSQTIALTSTQMGTSAFTPAVCIAGTTNGVAGYNSYGFGTITITDIGSI